jgi:hypothetical protein
MKARLFQRLVGHVTDGCLRRAGAGAARPNKNLWRHEDNRLGADRRILAEPFGRAARPGFLRVVAPTRSSSANRLHEASQPWKV